MGISNKINQIFFPDLSKRFTSLWEKAKHYQNSKGVINKLRFIISYYRYEKLSRKCHIRIPLGVCDEGLSLPHPEVIAISHGAKIGKNCRVQKMVSIGPAFGTTKCPKIGDNVYVGPGANLYGDIKIADNCWIGANAVVNKSFLEPYSVIAGVPAKVVKIETKNWMEVLKEKHDNEL